MPMEGKLQSIERLAAETAEQISRDYESWTRSLTSTALRRERKRAKI